MLERARPVGLSVAPLATIALLFASVAFAKDYLSDGARIFNADTAKKIVLRDAQLEQKTGQMVAVVTVPTSKGIPLDEAASRAALARHLNGVIIYVDRDARQFAIAYGPKARPLFAPSRQDAIEQSLRAAFRAGHYDSGILAALTSIADVLAGGASGGHGPALAPVEPQTPAVDQQQGGGFGWILWVVLIIAGIALMLGLLRRR